MVVGRRDAGSSKLPTPPLGSVIFGHYMACLAQLRREISRAAITQCSFPSSRLLALTIRSGSFLNTGCQSQSGFHDGYHPSFTAPLPGMPMGAHEHLHIR
jgi:hypothetical protein